MTGNDNQMDDAELARHGITRVEKHVFQWGPYLYTNLGDALAAAKRDRKA